MKRPIEDFQKRSLSSGISPPQDQDQDLVFVPEEFEALLEYFRTLKRWKEEAEMKKMSDNAGRTHYETA